jgi:uncharacterized repeat protein (TIGR02543 family)
MALAALFLGTINASGRSTATTTITVEVMGVGKVTSDPSGIKCGNGDKKCYIAYSTTGGSVTLKASPGGGWDHGDWDVNGTDCVGDTSVDCTISLDTNDHIVIAGFTKSSGTSQSTLNVTYDDSGGSADGHVLAPERDTSGNATTPGTEIDCGSGAGQTDCDWTVLTGSTLTLFEAPDAGDIFAGWGGACSGSTTGEACTVEMNGDKGVGASWAPSSDTVQLTVNVVGSGHVKGGGIDCPSKCVATVARNTAITLSADAGDGQILSSWGTPCSGAGPNCTVTMDDNTAITVTFVTANTLSVELVGNGGVSGGSGAINCGLGATICSANFAQNASVTLVATPATGATFAGWTGACGGTSTICTVSMSQSRSVTATFIGGTPPGGGTTFTLTVSVSGNGTVSGTGINCGNGATTCSSANHAANSTVTLTATPSTGATFAGWGGACTGTTPSCTVTFNASKTVTATFTGGTSNVQLTVSVTGAGSVTGGAIACGNGSAACSAQVAQGTTVTLTEKPATGSKFAGWGGSCAGAAPTCSVSMTSAKSVSATFTTGGTPGTLTINVEGKGTVSTTAGACTAVGPSKTCIQHFKAGASVTLAARPSAGQSFLGWSGACSGAKATCTVKLRTAQAVTANFSSKATGGGGGGGATAGLSAIGSPLVRKTSTGWNVILRFRSTASGVATVRGLRAGRTQVALSLRVAAGRATIGPIPVKLAGFYTFEIRLAGRLLRERACLGTCGRKHRGDPFTLTREAPTVTKTGDIWSVTLHAVSNQISDARIRAFRGSKLLVNQHFLGQATRMSLGPFLLGPGNYTLRLTAVDPYGRVRTLTWIVSLGR